MEGFRPADLDSSDEGIFVVPKFEHPKAGKALATPVIPAVEERKTRSVRRKPRVVSAAASDAATIEAREDIHLGFLIHDVSRMRRSAYDQFMKPRGITRAQWWVLVHLGRHDGMMQTQLADLLQVGKASLGDFIAGLETQKWVVRRPDPVDKRAKRVYLTPSARSVLERLTQMENRFNEHTLGRLSREQKTTLTKTLLVIKEALIEIDPATDEVGISDD